MNSPGQQSILIVDDNPKNIKVLLDILQQEGLQIAVAKSGESALSKVQKAFPDLILLDVMMPGIDGIETCRHLKAEPKTQEIPVIFLSALDDVAKKVEAFSVGGVDYITKPFQVQEVLARVRTHLALRAAQTQMRQLSAAVEKAAEGIARLDLQGRYTTVNKAYANMVGYQTDEMIGIEWQITVHPDDLEKMQAAYQQMCLDGNVEAEAKGVRKDGSIFYKQLVMTAAYDKQGKLIGHYCFTRDITERKQAEDALRESNERFFGAFKYAGIGMALVALDGRYLQVNQALSELVGYSEMELLATKFQAITHPDDLETNLGYVRQLLAGEIRSYKMEKRYFHKKGHIVWIFLSVSLVRDERGQPLYFVAQMKDISERKRAEQALRQSEKCLRRQQVGLIELAKNSIFYSGDLDAALRVLTEEGAHILDVERVSVWFYDAERTKICLKNLYELGSGQHSSGLELLAVDYPAYFQALETDKIVAAHEAQTDSQTREFSEKYLIPLRITSMLDVPIRSGGKTVGVICHEHVGSPRHWTIEEQNFASYLAYIASLSIEARGRARAEAALLYQVKKDRLVGRISRVFLNQDLDSAINFTLGAIGKFTKSDRSCFFRYGGQNLFCMTHAWCGDGSDLLAKARQDTSVEVSPWFLNKIFAGKPFQITNAAALPAEASQEKAELERHSIKSLLNVPIIHAGQVVGSLGLDAVNSFKTWSNEEMDLLKLVGKLIAIAMAKYEAESALRVSEERLQLALEGSGDGLWDWNIATGEVYFSPRWFTMLGYEADEFTASYSAWEAMLPPDDKPWIIDVLQAHLKDSSVPYAFDYRLQSKSGKWKWIANYGKVVARDRDGNPLRMTGTNRDITERKQREEILRNIALGISAEIGEAFFQSLVQYLTKALGIEYAFIGELVEPESFRVGKLVPQDIAYPKDSRIRTIAGYGNGRVIENFEYAIAHTPCENVVGQQLRVYPRNVQELFPLDAALKDMEAQSYLGVPLFDSENRSLGLIAVISRRALQDTRLMEEVLKIFAVRASSELERQQAEVQLHRQNRRSQLFAEIALKIRRSLQLDDILQTTVTEVQQLLGAQRVLILRFESPGVVRVVKEAVQPECFSVIDRGLTDDCLSSEYQKKYRQGRIYSIPDVDNSHNVPDCLIDFLREYQVKSKLVIPVLLQEELWGMIVVHQCSQAREWSTFEIDLLEQLANQVGIALAQSQSQEQFRSLIENASDLVTLIDTTGVVRYASPSVWRVLGYTPQESLGQPLSTWLHPEDRHTAAEIFTSALNAPETSLCVELRWQQRGGDWRVFEALAKQYRDSTGFVGVVVNFRDITERLKIEEMRRDLERERELSALKLRFFSMASHEFRTPLSIILMAAQVLENSSPEWLDAKKLRNIHRIQDAAKSLRQMLADVLTLARLEAQKLEFSPNSFDLYSFCFRLLDEIDASLAFESPIQFTYTGKTSHVCMDKKLLHSILTNLLFNALKYSPLGSEVNFDVTTEAEAVVFAVRDRGIGITLEDRKHLFEAFHRGENVDTIEGSGLGLAIVKKCVDLHGGQIAFDSIVGEGTTFIIRFPIGSLS